MAAAATLMLDYLGHAEAAKTIDEAVSRSFREGQTTPDLGGSLTTSQVGDLLARAASRREATCRHRRARRSVTPTRPCPRR